MDLCSYLAFLCRICTFQGSYDFPVITSTVPLPGPFVSVLVNAWGCRKVTISGSCLLAVSLILATFAPNISVFILIYGFMAGKLALTKTHIDGLAQDCGNPSAFATKSPQPCTKPYIYSIYTQCIYIYMIY